MYLSDKEQNIDMEKLQGDLERQYGPAIAQEIIDQLRRIQQITKVPDYMDVKAMSELQERFRAEAMRAICRLRNWRKVNCRVTPNENLILMEGAFLQRQCEDAIKLYRKANKAYFLMHRLAMAAWTVKTANGAKSAGRLA